MKKSIICPVVLLISLFWWSLVSADDTSLKYGTVASIVYPIDNDQITMLEAIVKVSFGWTESKVNCTFIFKNEGLADTVLMGFPKRKYSITIGSEKKYRLGTFEEKYLSSQYLIVDQQTMGPQRIVADMSDFSVTVDDENIKTTIAQSGGLAKYNTTTGLPLGSVMNMIQEYYVWEVPFEPGEVKTVKHEYLYHNTYEGYADLKNGWSQFEYILRTGSTWKGPIGKVEVMIEGIPVSFSPYPGRPATALIKEVYNWVNEHDDMIDYIQSIYPRGYTRTRDVITWHYENLEPTFDIKVRVRTGASSYLETMIIRNYLSADRSKDKNVQYVMKWSDLSIRIELKYIHTPEEFYKDPHIWLDPRCLYHFKPAELTMLRQAIDAFHGKDFSDPALKSFFAQFPWYKPSTSFSECSLTMTDHHNVREIDRSLRLIEKWQ
ncbi:YARHG domain-containing protein [candidate division CSSED10-310 bacterium]|uniref:YARHG domain-containing protein n=1 Tax=candidate division CSSED10-310 bacterium TaxID=2855610 RepID=A0ABV6YSR6_UNCC1